MPEIKLKTRRKRNIKNIKQTNNSFFEAKNSKNDEIIVKNEKNILKNGKFYKNFTKIDQKGEKLAETKTIYASKKSVLPHLEASAFSTVDVKEDVLSKPIAEQKVSQLKAKRAKLEDMDGKKKSYYVGQKGYTDFKPKNDNVYVSKINRPGPQPPPSHIRNTTFFDYKPDLCKDYKETGYCGYGDTCKFVHDRTDYKSGWELEKEWQIDQLQKNSTKFSCDGEEENSKFLIQEEIEGDSLYCPLCNEEFKRKVQTNCGHSFCEKCAIENYSKSPKCFICGKDTKGIFNSRKKLSKNERKNMEENSTEDFAKFNKGVGFESSWSYS